MQKNYIPYLRCNEFEEVYTPAHFHTGNDFFTLQRSCNLFDSIRKNIDSYPNHSSEYSQIIPQDSNYFDNGEVYKNNNYLETKDLSLNDDFLYSSRNIHLNDMNYQKYILNIKKANNSSKSKKLNKKNNSQSKFLTNYETYNIIQIYEAPPLELTPISENEKNESAEKRKTPKYYRKKTIYSLENNKENKNKLFDLNYNELEKIRKKYENKNQDNNYNYNTFLKHTKLNNSKTKKIVQEKEEKNEKNYFRYFTKDTNFEPKIIDNTANIKYEKYLKTDSNKNTKDNNKYKISDNKEEKEKEKENITKNNNNKNENIDEKKLYKRIDNKSFIQNQTYQITQILNEDKQFERKLTIDNKKIDDNNKNKLNKEQMIKNKENKNIEDKNKEDKNKEDKNKINEKEEKSNKNKEGIKKGNNIIYKYEKVVEEKPLINNILYNNNTNPKNRGEKKIDKFERQNTLKEKELKTPQQITIRGSLRQIKGKDNNNKEILMTDKEIKKEKKNVILNVEVDKAQLSNNKRTYLYGKSQKEPAPIQSIQNSAKANKINNEQEIKTNYSKKYVYSFSVEKNKEEKIEKEKNYTEKKKNEGIDKTKLNEIKNDKNSKNLNLQLYKINNRSTLSKKFEVINKNNNFNRNKNIIIRENSNIGFFENNNNSDIKRKGMATPIHQDKNKIEESKNNDIASFGNTARKNIYNININSNNNNKIIDSKKYNNNNVKENINNIKNNVNKDKKENNLKTIINITHKSIYRNNHNNHNYIAIKSSGTKKINNITQYRPIRTEKSEKIIGMKKIRTPELNNDNPINNDVNPSISIPNKNEQKQIIIRDNNRRLTNDINNCNINNNGNTSSSNNNNYQLLRGTSVKSVDITAQNNNDIVATKRKNVICQNNNHSIKVSYGVTTHKMQNEKKDENKTVNFNNIIKNNEVNFINNYVNSKIIVNNNTSNINNSINVNSSNINNDIKINGNNNFVNFNNNRRDVRAKNNHSLYVSIVSKK